MPSTTDFGAVGIRERILWSLGLGLLFGVGFGTWDRHLGHRWKFEGALAGGTTTIFIMVVLPYIRRKKNMDRD